MGSKDQKNSKSPNQSRRIPLQDQDSQSQSNQTMPINALEQLDLDEGPEREKTIFQANFNSENYSFLKSKPIRRRRNNQRSQKDRLKQKIIVLSQRVAQLQQKLYQARKQQDSCPHCHFYLNQVRSQRTLQNLNRDDRLICDSGSPGRDSLQFQKMDFQAPLVYNTQMEEKSWIFLGTVLIAMGSKVMDNDGTVNVFKIVKQSVDQIRRQVQKSQDKLSMNFFMGKQQIEAPQGMQELDFDPFYSKQQQYGGLQLQSVRVESVQEYELYFDQKLTFNIKYDALITAMQYMKQNSSLSFG